MAKVLYQIVVIKPRRQRTAAMRTWKQYTEIKETYAAFRKTLKKHKVPVPSMNIRYNLQDLKQRYFKELGMSQVRRKLTRLHDNHLYECSLQERKGDNSGYTLHDAMMRIRKDIQERRKARRFVSDRIQRRQAGAFLKEYFNRVFKNTKIPRDMKAGWTGLELECLIPAGADFSPLMPFAKYINIGHDGSIHVDSAQEEGREVRVCIHRSEIRIVIPELLKALRGIGAHVNKSCGMHVHLDQRQVKDPENTFARLVRSLGLLYQVVPASRRDNSYCKRNRHTNWNDARGGSRYKAINADAFSRYGTIEVRLFGGTLSADKVCNWVEILWAIADGGMVLRSPKSFEAARKHWQFSDENLAWLNERAAMFDENGAVRPSNSEGDSEPESAPVVGNAQSAVDVQLIREDARRQSAQAAWTMDRSPNLNESIIASSNMRIRSVENMLFGVEINNNLVPDETTIAVPPVAPSPDVVFYGNSTGGQFGGAMIIGEDDIHPDALENELSTEGGI